MAYIRYLAIASMALLAAGPAGARDKAGEKLSAAIHREMAAQGPIMTDADHALKSAAVAEAQARVAEETAARAMKHARAALRQR